MNIRTNGRRLALVAALVALSGCSVAMSANRSSYKGDPSIIKQGADRQVIETTLGAPDMMASLDNGKTKVIYKIDPNAVKATTRDAEVAGDVVGDVLTLGLWEVVATPIEIASQDKYTTYIVVYGTDNKVESVETIK